jgi:hypothetical protein
MFRFSASNKRPGGSPGLFCKRRDELTSENGAQRFRNRLVEDVIIERVKQVSPIGLAGKKVADIAVDRRDCDVTLHRKAFYGEAHCQLFLLQHEVPFVTFGTWCARSGHVQCLFDDEMPTVCNTNFIPSSIASQSCKVAWNECASLSLLPDRVWGTDNLAVLGLMAAWMLGFSPVRAL